MELKYIKGIGIELEGLFHKLPNNATHDGSVGGPQGIFYDDEDGTIDSDLHKKVMKAAEVSRGSSSEYYQGESRSDICYSFEEVREYVLKNYPIKSNGSCGLHIHLSFKKPLYYALLMEQSFNIYFLKELEDWGLRANIQSKNFWKRLRGDNDRYCARSFRPESQVWRQSKSDNRYTQLNYCYGLKKTLEFRLLPMFKDHDLAVTAIKKVMEITEEYLINIFKDYKTKVYKYKLIKEEEGELSTCA